MIKASTESVFALAENLNKKKLGTDSDQGIYSSKSEAMQSEEESEVIIKKDHKNKAKKVKGKKEMTFLNKTSEDEDKQDSSVVSKP